MPAPVLTQSEDGVEAVGAAEGIIQLLLQPGSCKTGRMRCQCCRISFGCTSLRDRVRDREQQTRSRDRVFSVRSFLVACVLHLFFFRSTRTRMVATRSVRCRASSSRDWCLGALRWKTSPCSSVADEKFLSPALTQGHRLSTTPRGNSLCVPSP